MLIGALSLVIVVWLGTSMNFSRMSTFAGRSMTGIRKRSPGSRTRLGPVRPRRKMTIRSYCCTTRIDRYSATSRKTTTAVMTASVTVSNIELSLSYEAVPSAGSTISVSPS